MKKNKKSFILRILSNKYLVIILFFILIAPMNVVAYTWGTKNWWIKINPAEISSSLVIDQTVYTIKNTNIIGANLLIPTRTMIDIKSLNFAESQVNKNNLGCAIPAKKEGTVITRTLTEAGTELSEEDKKAPKIMAELDITVSDKVINPASFLIAANLPTFLKFISGDNQAHEIVFEAPELQEASLSIAAGESQGIVFNIPVSGEYKFHCSVPDHKKERGIMIVK